MSIELTVPPKRELKPRITVMGVGGAGGNAVNNMIKAGLEGVEFVVANTDAQALAGSEAERHIQMGVQLTEGLGAGSDPNIGREAAEEAMAEIADQIQGSHMVFITAGMGGGTGTGAAPVIARACREQGILTIGVVTKPFDFEGPRRMQSADIGITELTKEVDTLIIIPNQNLFRVANEKTGFVEAFAIADEVLHSGVASVTDLMTKPGLINLDFADVKMVMNEMGKAMMGTGEQEGENRAIGAAEAAIANPLLEDDSMQGATGLLISITGGKDMTLYEVDEAANRIKQEVAANANIIIGAIYDESLEGSIRVSVVATGIESDGLGENAKPRGPRLVKLPQRDSMPDIPPETTAPPITQAESQFATEATDATEAEAENSTAMPAMPAMPTMADNLADNAAHAESAKTDDEKRSDRGGGEIETENNIPSFLTDVPERPEHRPLPKRHRSFLDRVLRGRDENSDIEPPAEQPFVEPPIVEQPAEQAVPQPAAHKVAPPQVARPQVETPQAETQQVETSQMEAPQGEVASPQVAPPQVETPKEEPPQVALPQMEPPQAETPQVETSQAAPPQVETSQVETPQAETSQAETSQVETPQEATPQVETSQVAQAEAEQTIQPSQGEEQPTAPIMQADMSSNMASGGYDDAQLDIPAFLRRQSD